MQSNRRFALGGRRRRRRLVRGPTGAGPALKGGEGEGATSRLGIFCEGGRGENGAQAEEEEVVDAARRGRGGGHITSRLSPKVKDEKFFAPPSPPHR